MGRYTTGSVDEAAEIQQMLANANSIMYPSSDILLTPWMIDGAMGDSQWLVKNNGRNKELLVYFSHVLPDGTNLCDPCNRVMLDSVQQLAALMRNNPTIYPMTAQRWAMYIATNRQICSWLTLHKNKYEPNQFGFMRLDKNALTNLMTDLSIGGWTEALQYIPRTIEAIHTLIHSPIKLASLLETPHDLPENFVKEAVKYFSKNKWYTKARQRSGTKADGAISRVKVGSLIGCDQEQLHHDQKIRVFLRQFEPALAHSTLLINASPRANFHSQNTLTLKEAKNHRPTKAALKDQIAQLSAIFSCHKFLPHAFPQIEIDSKETLAALKANTSPTEHHNTLPLGIGLHLLQQACKWVVLYGDSIVEACLFYAKESQQFNDLNKGQRTKALDNLYRTTCHIWRSTETEELKSKTLIEDLNIKCRQLRETRSINPEEMSLHQVFEGYIGACGTLIGMLKPIREAELAHLTRDSLYLSTLNDGLWLEQKAGKKGSYGINPFIQRPIPSIVGQAVGQLQKLGENLKAINLDTSTHSDELFYFPSTKYFPTAEGKHVKQRLARAMDTFCDITETKLDASGRRWYVRIHELRRFFIHTIYRHETSHVLDAIGWAAGHVDADHTRAYYEDNLRGEELQGYEAESITSRLITFGANNANLEKLQGTAALYKRVCEIHNINNLASLSTEDYQNTIKRMLADGGFSVQHYIVGLQTPELLDLDIEIAIVIGDHADEKIKQR